MDFSVWQVAIVLVIALLVFGPKRLPELGRGLGGGMREFKDSITAKGHDDRTVDRTKPDVFASERQPEPETEPVDVHVIDYRA